MESYESILQRKIDYYGKKFATYESAADEYATRMVIDEIVSILKMAKLNTNEKVCLVLENRISELKAMIKTIDS